MKVGFIGLGMMGGPMCRNLIKKGHQAIVCDLNADALARIQSAGATAAASPQDVAYQAQVVFLSLPMPADVEQVVLGPKGVTAGAQRGTVIVDLSTNAPAVVKRLAQQLAEKGITFLDSPVSGGVDGAEAATLAVMVGGDKPAFDKVKPLLECIGKNVFHLGPIGSGSVAKICNNMVSFCNLAVASEAVLLAQRAGMDPQTMVNVMQTASGASNSLKRVDRKAIHGDFKQEFALNLAYKDLTLALELGRETGSPLAYGSYTYTLMQQARAKGRGTEDVCTLMRVLEEAVNTQVRT
ncbi:MAG TPA: NAD(P)-dependent oxidoreductase, partial [bacterium]|nr:NAD(P)-dependent oxidoreductase [bacterium]